MDTTVAHASAMASSASAGTTTTTTTTALRRQKQLLGHLQGEAKTLQPISPKTHIARIAVYGAGIMGSGIAQVAAAAEYTVVLWDVEQSDLDRGVQAIRRSLDRLQKKRSLSGSSSSSSVDATMGRITTTTDKLGAARSADLVIEAIVEDLATKQSLFAALDTVAPARCIFATNTSSLLVRDISAHVSASRKQRTVALHFFNPVPLMRLVEIACPAADNNDDQKQEEGTELVALLKAWVHDIGKVPVVCKDTPGFIVNRLLVPFNSEARMLVERGDASLEAVDTAMKLGAGHPMGPFELMDLTGIDVGHHIAKAWYESEESGLKGDPRFKPSPLVERMLADGHLGRKTGRGYYNYNKKK
ncbi:hypothetical protein IWW48_004636 [Coemansia sp. RSA 1200]|nr:hypothetical protein IWW48_004636 [Coemansia sp. RSA 1200]